VFDLRPAVRILGIRGVPAAHGGFETFAEQLALHLVARGWRVVVYCQEDGAGATTHDEWRGIERVHIHAAAPGARGTMQFDWRAIHDAAQHRDLCLTLGYNTALFCAWLRLRGVRNVINMDGIEWSRAKWGPFARAWLWLNERAGCWLGDHLVADHPEIAAHLTRHARTDKITMIPYGAVPVEEAPHEALPGLGLEAGRYLTLIARPEPENSVLEAVQGFSRARRGVQLAVLGRYDPAVPYHAAVLQAAGPEVRFLGAIYDAPLVRALRFHSLAYVHGHQVGGTNPSLVEALGAGNAVLAHDNRFNRWVAGAAAQFFSDAGSFDALLGRWLNDHETQHEMRHASRARHSQAFTWPQVLDRYEALLQQQQPT
jgi:glycosyltransferase involved in cell wall biosynthesis